LFLLACLEMLTETACFLQDSGRLQFPWHHPWWARKSAKVILHVRISRCRCSGQLRPMPFCASEVLCFWIKFDIIPFQGTEFKSVLWRNTSFAGKSLEPLLVWYHRQSVERSPAGFDKWWNGSRQAYQNQTLVGPIILLTAVPLSVTDLKRMNG
jgi:hypothetical protein